jgi:hypothetical protein
MAAADMKQSTSAYAAVGITTSYFADNTYQAVS